MFYVGDRIVAQTSIDEVVHSLLKNFIKLGPSKGREGIEDSFGWNISWTQFLAPNLTNFLRPVFGSVKLLAYPDAHIYKCLALR